MSLNADSVQKRIGPQDGKKVLICTILSKKHSGRRKHCARTRCSMVRTPPARPLQTHRQDR